MGGTINLQNVLTQLKTPEDMEKTAMMSEGKTDSLESKEADPGEEKPAEEGTAAEAKKEGESMEEEKKEDESPEGEKKEEANEEMEKEASVSPVNGLQKIAQEIAEADHKVMIKEAQVFGSVMADSFANRLAEIQNVVDSQPSVEKTAMEKTAMEKQAHDEYMTKVATELYHNMDSKDADLVESLVKTAAVNGMHITPEQAFSALADEAIAMGEQAALEKVAAEEVFTKLSSEDHARLSGFSKTAALMGETGFDKVASFNYLASQAMEAGAEAARSEQGQEKVASEEQQIVQNFIKEAAENGYNLTEQEAIDYLTKVAQEQQTESELNDMEKVAADMEARGDKEGVAAMEKAAYDKGFEETLIKVAAHTSGLGYAQTQKLMA